jgi:hypothetical protein
MSWNREGKGTDIFYQVSPAVRFRNVQELLSVPKFVSDIYDEIKEKKVTNKNNIIEIRSSEYAKLSYSWKKKKRLFGVDVRINDNMNVGYRILPLRSGTEL